MDAEKFPWCCGIYILKNFGHTTSGFAPAGVTKADLETPTWRDKKRYWSEPSKEEVIAYVKHSKTVYASRGMLLAALDQFQKDIIGPWLEEEDFKIIANAGNEFGKYPIYLYAYILNEVKK